MDRINILLASEFPLLRRGMAAYLQEQQLVERLYDAESIAEASALLQTKPIDVAVIELDLLKPSGLRAISALLHLTLQLRVVVVSRGEIEPFVTQCMARGALGYLLLDSQPEEFLCAMRTVGRFEQYLSRGAASVLALARVNDEPHPLSILSRREYEVFIGLAQGATVSEIAAALGLSNKTVYVYRGKIFAKLGICSAVELPLLAIRYGVITAGAAEPTEVDCPWLRVDSKYREE